MSVPTVTLILGSAVVVGTHATVEEYRQAGGETDADGWAFLTVEKINGERHQGVLRYRPEAVQGEIVAPAKRLGRAVAGGTPSSSEQTLR